MSESQTPPPERLAEWKSALDALLRDIDAWASEQGWPVAWQPRLIHERTVGAYEAPDLNVKVPGGTLVVEVKGRDVAGGLDGRVDVLAWPQLHRMLLIRRGDRWLVKTDAGIDWPQPWGRQTFLDLARTLTQAA